MSRLNMKTPQNIKKKKGENKVKGTSSMIIIIIVSSSKVASESLLINIHFQPLY